jgi:hypothetical protein
MPNLRNATAWLAAAASIAIASACGRSDEPASTPLPTRQTTIDPVNKKLDAAAKDMESRRQAVDDAAK